MRRPGRSPSVRQPPRGARVRESCRVVKASSRPRVVADRARAMKRIGLLGGMSWESSAEYYRTLNEAVRDRLGGLHSADCVMHSVDFTTVEVLQRGDRWDEAARLLTRHARGLERAGAQCLVLCTNTMHRVADEVQAGIDIPLLHIADATARRVHAAGTDGSDCWRRATRWSRTSTRPAGRPARPRGRGAARARSHARA